MTFQHIYGPHRVCPVVISEFLLWSAMALITTVLLTRSF